MRSQTHRAILALALPAWLIACSESPTDPSCVVNSVVVTGAPTALQVNATVQLGATVDSDDCNSAPTVSWSTSAAGRATVSQHLGLSGRAHRPIASNDGRQAQRHA